MIDLPTERQRNAFARVRGAVEQLRYAVTVACDSMLDGLDTLADSLPSTAPEVSSPQLVDIDKAAEILNVSPATVTSFVRQGALRVVVLPSGRGDRPIKRFALAELASFGDRHSKVGVA